MWGCASHWFTLPIELRRAISKAWNAAPGKITPEWTAANNAAIAWIADSPARIKAMNIGKDTPVPGTGGLHAHTDKTGG